MRKMGRPTKDDPSFYRVTVRFTRSEYEQLKKYADTHNLTMTEVIKTGLHLLFEENK